MSGLADFPEYHGNSVKFLRAIAVWCRAQGGSLQEVRQVENAAQDAAKDIEDASEW